MTLEHLMSIVQHFGSAYPQECAILQLAFVHGQRLPDMVQLSVTDLETCSDSCVVHVRRGKVMNHKPPFTLALHWGRSYTADLMKAKKAAEAKGWNFFLSESNTETEREAATSKLREMLHWIGPVKDATTVTTIGGSPSPRSLEIRSVRRGGLQQMAMAGFSLALILNYSKHSDIPMLLKYLDNGAKSTCLRRELMDPIATLYESTHSLTC
jgi:hypothetical protein